MEQKFRSLSEEERKRLKIQGCVFEDGCEIQVAVDFTPDYVNQVKFSGKIRLGTFMESFDLPGGMQKHSGIAHATLHNVTVGDNCLIENIKNYLANYVIGERCYIDNVDIILVDTATSFGNGVEVAVMNETGGREVAIHDRLSAQEAYMMTLYRHRPDFIEKMRRMVNCYVEQVTSTMGFIGHHVTIVNTGYIKNVKIGNYATLEGVGRLRCGSINSNEQAPVHLGYGVVAEDFIISSGTHIEDGTMLTRCFVGQACVMGHSYSASDSLFFSNCQEENGEACAVFAGPFTVTHHKSTLLIAGMFSFMNAGSGSNQSNHMYKLGPIHQGILERGAKTASDSYILWPSHIGPFTLVMGRHTKNSDISDMPFSYLIEEGRNSYLVPAVNLRSVGTVRDAQKWPKRDHRTDFCKLDCINYNLLSPYTVAKMMKGLKILHELVAVSGEGSEFYSYQSLRIKRSALMRGVELYNIAIRKFLGNSLISCLQKCDLSSIVSIREGLQLNHHAGRGVWLDLSGLIVPQAEVQRLMDDVEHETISSCDVLAERLQRLHADYYDMEWTWACKAIEDYYKIDLANVRVEQLIDIIVGWKDAVVQLDKMLYEDARKEFSLSSMTGFGADGDQADARDDFEQVRGDFESNAFVLAVLEHIRVKSALGDGMVGQLKKLIEE